MPASAVNIKHPGMDQEKGGRMLVAPARSRRIRPLVLGFITVVLIYLSWSPITTVLSLLPSTSGLGGMPYTSTLLTAAKAPVPLEAHIMSKCPDAQECLRMLVLPAMVRVSEKVNFTLSFIGTPTANDGVDCMHGPGECMGNIVELCAAELYPDPKLYLGFTMCLMKEYEHIPEKSLIEDCALEHSLDFAKLNECATRDDGGFGMGLLRDSVRRSKDAGVTKSCTVRLNNEIYCVRDGAEWKDCPHGPGVNDLVIAVEKLYQSS